MKSRYFSTPEMPGDLKAEFDMLYAESSKRRRMMSVSAHDRIAGRPSAPKSLKIYRLCAEQSRSRFLRKAEIRAFRTHSVRKTIREGI